MNHPPHAVTRGWSVRSIEQSIPARFEDQAAANRGRLAVGAADRCLSYGALNDAANRVARAVLATAPQTRAVAVLIGQGASVLVALLGVLKAGKVFVPLDPRQPGARNRQILDDCEAQLLVTDDRSLTEARTLVDAGRSLVNVDAQDGTFSSADLGLQIAGGSPACLLYTSGSTGSPKGVLLAHRSLLHRTKAYTSVLGLGQDDRLTLLATCSVGQGLSSALLALLNGASLHPFDLHELGVAELAPWLVAHGITIFVSTPSTFRHFAKTVTTRDAFPTLRAIRLGGERIVPHDFELYRQHFPKHCVLVGEFASTETGPVTTYVMNHGTRITDCVPVGYPLDGMTVTILDEAGAACSPGTIGEIGVRSRLLSSGYWRDPERTAAAFVEVPGAVGERLYRTGDLGTMRPDGCLEHRGRKDSRVKIRGFRVELEEIEAALCVHPLVLEAAVATRPVNTGADQLAAYVVSQPGPRPTAHDLRAHLSGIVPEPMVPASFEFVPTLPRTASGKVHREALATRRETTSGVTEIVHPPRDAVEVYLTSLWEDLFEQRPIEVTADFFELGGHSLLAARLSAAIERTFGTKLPLAAFVRAATIQQQARLLRERRPRSRWPSLVPIRATGSKPPLFCVHLRDGSILSYRDLVRYLPADQPLYGLQSRGLDGIGRINTRIEDMARDYVAEIRTSHPQGPYAICGWSFGGVVAFEMARQLEQEGQNVALLALFDTYPPGGAGPEIRLRHTVTRVPTRVTRLLHGPDRAASLRQGVETARLLLQARLRRMLVMWLRHGGWLPRTQRNITLANRGALRDYVPRAYGGRITMFKAAQPESQCPRDPAPGWMSLAAGGLEIHEVPGTHLTMVFEPHARTLAEQLASRLDETWQACGAVPSSGGTEYPPLDVPDSVGAGSAGLDAPTTALAPASPSWQLTGR